MPKYNLIEEEINWCETHRNPEQKVYQDGFIAGLKHAFWLMKSRPTKRAADVCHESPSKTHSWYGSSQGYVCEHCGTRR